VLAGLRFGRFCQQVDISPAFERVSSHDQANLANRKSLTIAAQAPSQISGTTTASKQDEVSILSAALRGMSDSAFRARIR